MCVVCEQRDCAFCWRRLQSVSVSVCIVLRYTGCTAAVVMLAYVDVIG